MKRWMCLGLLLTLLAGPLGAFAENALTLPKGLKAIEAEVFYGDLALSEVVLPASIASIGERAFAFSSVKRINLPASIRFIADNAFDGCDLECAYADGAYCLKWCADHGITTRTRGQDENEGERDVVP